MQRAAQQNTKTFLLLTLFSLCVNAQNQSTETQKIPGLSSEPHHQSYQLSPKYDRVVYSRYVGDVLTSVIYQRQKNEDGEWLAAEPLQLGPTQYSYGDPMLSHDGKTLYFVSNQPLSSEDSPQDDNIWQASLMDKQWKNIRPLPAPVNSDADEGGPELHEDILYFDSNRSGEHRLYQARKKQAQYRVSSWQTTTAQNDSFSDLTFSPDGKIALFVKTTARDKKQQLVMQHNVDGSWQKTQIIAPLSNSEQHISSPHFSPDGRLVYFASRLLNSPQTNNTLYQIATEKLFPQAIYLAHLGPKHIEPIASLNALEKTDSFSYQLQLTIKEKVRKEQGFIAFKPLEICKIKDGITRWTNGDIGLSLSDGKISTLPEKDINRLLNGVRYNFVYMLKQADTEFRQVYGNSAETGRLFRVHAQGLEEFTILLSEDMKRIEELRYDDQAVGLEYDYQQHQQISWPMQFDIMVNGKSVVHGQFSDIKINAPHLCQSLKTESASLVDKTSGH